MLKNDQKQELEKEVVATEVMPEVEVKESVAAKIWRVTKKVAGYVVTGVLFGAAGYAIGSSRANTECYEDSNVAENETIESNIE